MMIHHKSRIAIYFLLTFSSGFSAAMDCPTLAEHANEVGVITDGCTSGRKVIGTGRLQFYSAPNLNCVQNGVFILSGEKVESYSTYKDFTSVMYFNEKTGGDASGWVMTSRLRGTGVGGRKCEKTAY